MKAKIQFEQKVSTGARITVELRASDAQTTCGAFSKWGSPARVWVRHYDPTGKKVGQETLGFCDARHTGPRSHAGRLIERAKKQAQALAASLEPKVFYAIFDEHVGHVWGIGYSVQAAWDDAAADQREDGQSDDFSTGFECREITRALYEAVKRRGGCVPSAELRYGKYGTRAEYEEMCEANEAASLA